MPFVDQSRSEQLRALRAVASDALTQFGHADARLELVEFEFNATYRVTTSSGDRYAMRLNVNSTGDADQVRAEVAWVAALAEETDVLLPLPQLTRDGERFALVWFEPLDRDVPVVLYTWLGGRHLEDRSSDERVGTIGTAMAAFHDQAETWRVPKGLTFRRVDTLIMDMDDHLTGLDRPWYDAESRALVEETRTALENIAAPVFRRGPEMVIHADLHFGNVKWVDGRLGVFDFDDAGWGVPALDLAISAYYLRDLPGKEDALRRGYSAVRSLSDCSAEEFEALVAARNFTLLNFVVSSVTSGFDEFASGYLTKSTARFRHFLRTGRFELDVQG